MLKRVLCTKGKKGGEPLLSTERVTLMVGNAGKVPADGEILGAQVLVPPKS